MQIVSPIQNIQLYITIKRTNKQLKGKNNSQIYIQTEPNFISYLLLLFVLLFFFLKKKELIYKSTKM